MLLLFSSKKFFQSRKRWRSELVLYCSSLPSVSFFAWCFALHQLLLTFCHTNQRILLAYLRLWKSIRNAELYWNFCIGARKSLKFAEIVYFQSFAKDIFWQSKRKSRLILTDVLYFVLHCTTVTCMYYVRCLEERKSNFLSKSSSSNLKSIFINS